MVQPQQILTDHLLCFLNYFYVNGYLFCTARVHGTHRQQTRASDVLELQLQLVVSCQVGAGD